MADNTQFSTTSSNRGLSQPNQGENRIAGGGSNAGKSGNGNGGDTDLLGKGSAIGNELIGAVRERTDSMLSEQKSRAAEEIKSVASMLRSAAASLDQSHQGAIADYAESAAQQIDDFAGRIRDASWGELAGDAEDFARRWPVLFMGAAIGIGFIAGRFLTASASASQSSGSSYSGGSSEMRAGSRQGSTSSTSTSSMGGSSSGMGEAKAGYGASSGASSGMEHR